MSPICGQLSDKPLLAFAALYKRNVCRYLGRHRWNSESRFMLIARQATPI